MLHVHVGVPGALASHTEMPTATTPVTAAG